MTDNVTPHPTAKTRPNQGTPLELDNPETLAAIKQGFEDMEKLRAQSESINAKKKAIVDGLVARGLHRQGILSAFAHKRSGGDKAAEFTEAYQLGAKALELPLEIAPPPEKEAAAE